MSCGAVLLHSMGLGVDHPGPTRWLRFYFIPLLYFYTSTAPSLRLLAVSSQRLATSQWYRPSDSTTSTTSVLVLDLLSCRVVSLSYSLLFFRHLVVAGSVVHSVLFFCLVVCSVLLLILCFFYTSLLTFVLCSFSDPVLQTQSLSILLSSICSISGLLVLLLYSIRCGGGATGLVGRPRLVFRGSVLFCLISGLFCVFDAVLWGRGSFCSVVILRTRMLNLAVLPFGLFCVAFLSA